MRLSDAIPLGRLMGRPRPHVLAGCAQGMALRAIGSSLSTEICPMGIGNHWAWTLELIANFPCGCKQQTWEEKGWFKGADTRSAIAHLFDEHVFGAKDWTLDELIDWVRSVEPPEPAEQPAATQSLKEEVCAIR